MSKPIYYHGGRADLQRGAFLLPPSITRAPHCSEYGAQGVHRIDRVYVATMFEIAAMFAAGHRNGAVYQCEPVGPLEVDPDCGLPGTSFQCEKARIVRVFRLTPSQMTLVRHVLLETSGQA